MQSVLFGLLAMLFGGLYDFSASILSKKIGDKKAVLGVLGTSALVVFMYCLFTRQSFDPHGLILLLILMAIGQVVGYLAFNMGVLAGLTSVVAPIGNATSVITIPLAIIFLHASLTVLQVVLILVLIFGIFLTSTDLKTFLHTKRFRLFEGVREGLLAMVGWGIAIIILVIASQTIGAFLPLFYCRLIGTVLFAGYLLKTDRKSLSVPVRWLWLVIVAGIFDILGLIILAQSSHIYNAPVILAIGSTAPLVTLVLAMIIHKERPLPNQYVGIAVITLAVIGLSF